MPSLLFSFLLEINSYPLLKVMYVFVTLLGILLVCTLAFTIYKRKIDSNKKLWEPDAALLISTAIFYNANDTEYKDAILKNEKLLQKAVFRQYLINEIIIARKDISGSSTSNLKNFYEQLKLNQDSFKKLHNRKWHIKTKGIQELAIMEQNNYQKEIFELANYSNEYVRNEAQCSLVNFYGFQGLEFLNDITYPISEWQQIQLLNKLNSVKPQNFEIIKKWLHSKNEFVVIFALKLAVFYNHYELYDDVVNCLSYKNLQIKLNAVNYLKLNPRENTAALFITDYSFDNKIYKLAILDALKDIGNETEITFLLKQLHNADNDIKIAAAKALACLHPLGITFFHTHLFADENPWKSIFLQIENDRAA